LPTAFRFLIILLALVPVLALTDDWLGLDLSAIGAASLLLLVTFAAHQEDLKITVQLLRKIQLAILFPIAWMVLQIAPLNLFANSIWPTASTALGEPLLGSISIDPGATIRSLFVYLTMVSFTAATVVLTRDRERAETTLFVLCTVTTFMSIEMLLGQFAPFAGIVPIPGQPAAATFAAIAALGTVVSIAAAIRVIERRLSRREDWPKTSSILTFSLSLAGAVVCLGAILIADHSKILIVAGLGIAVIALIGVTRIVARPWSAGVLLAILALVAAGIIAAGFDGNPGVVAILRFATDAPPDSVSVTQRALSDIKWVGSGVGTFDALVPVYRDFGSNLAIEPASTIAKVAIEWGRAAAIVVVLIVAQLFLVLFAGGRRRGRDWFLPAAASATIVVLLGEAFCDASLTHPSTQIIAAVIVGLGLSQSIGRTSGGL
jgi:hypothetical protein